MPQFFKIKHKTDPTKICVRDLRPGMIIPIEGGKTAAVHSVEWMNGKNGEPPQMIAGDGHQSAIAMKVYFHEREPVIAHPGWVVTTR